ncbi:hypothetical protein O9K51_00060 [Purpureocillium lavendulum]|uniref:Uncharacterized protein n=1 Tax=Purpureocillium lavendulum TaxID=1247861 RepID=A0AB34G3Z8_9HYPO|nr:hypothetical protein O9K51_00060 [Purpureocillium lavendulum]
MNYKLILLLGLLAEGILAQLDSKFWSRFSAATARCSEENSDKWGRCHIDPYQRKHYCTVTYTYPAISGDKIVYDKVEDVGDL